MALNQEIKNQVYMKKIGWKIRYFSTHDLHRFPPQPCYIKIPVLICRVFFCHHWWDQSWQLDRCGTVCIYCLSGDFPERIMFYKGLMAWTHWLNETAKFLEQQGCLSQWSCCWDNFSYIVICCSCNFCALWIFFMNTQLSLHTQKDTNNRTTIFLKLSPPFPSPRK